MRFGAGDGGAPMTSVSDMLHRLRLFGRGVRKGWLGTGRGGRATGLAGAEPDGVSGRRMP